MDKLKHGCLTAWQMEYLLKNRRLHLDDPELIDHYDEKWDLEYNLDYAFTLRDSFEASPKLELTYAALNMAQSYYDSWREKALNASEEELAQWIDDAAWIEAHCFGFEKYEYGLMIGIALTAQGFIRGNPWTYDFRTANMAREIEHGSGL